MTEFIQETTISEEDLFPSLAGLLEDILTPQLEIERDPFNPNQYIGLFIETLVLDLPIEIQTLRNESNDFEVGVSPSTQWIETTVQPLLHQMRVKLELDDGESRDETLES